MNLKFCYALAGFFSIMSLCAKAQTVILDYHFNHETRKNEKGEQERFHYMWEEKDYNGFSILGEVFKTKGFTLKSLDAAPTATNLNSSQVYIIVDPDSKKENPLPNYIQPEDVTNISAWVKRGGVLVMFANDSANVELAHFNSLAAIFGLHFGNERTNHVTDDNHFEDGGVTITNNSFFRKSKKIFMKDACVIKTTGNAKPVLKNSFGATLIAYSKFGKGTVIAIADPWLYDEYTNGRLPEALGFQNDKAALDLVIWIKNCLRK